MKKPYLTWWYPAFDNPDQNASVHMVRICTNDQWLIVFLKNLPDGLDLTDVAIQYQQNGGQFSTFREDGYLLLMAGGHITMDRAATELEILCKAHPALNSQWFNDELAQHKKLAGLQPTDAADYDVRACSEPLLKRVYTSRHGGTIAIRNETEIDWATPVVPDRAERASQLKQALVALSNEKTSFTVDADNPDHIHFQWHPPIIAVGRDRPEYLSMQAIFNFLDKNIAKNILDVSEDKYWMQQQVAGRIL